MQDKLAKDLFFNVFLESIIEGFFSILICGYLNFKTLELSSFGEITGAFLSYYCLLFTLIIILICNFWVAIAKNKEQVNSP